MINENKFLSFPFSLYMAKKALGLSIKIIKYAVYNKCHKLYEINEILNKNKILTCQFINYPNYSMVKKIDNNNNIFIL